jgi:hypothetical protein
MNSETLTAYFDEGNDERVYLIGGWLGSATTWEQFSEAWRNELQAAPSIEYFKNNDAMGLKNQFANWTQDSRDEKLLAFARIIANHELVGLVGGVGLASFNSLFAGSIVPKKKLRSIVKFTEPYHFACQCVISVTFGYQVKRAKNLTDQVNFIFDEGVRFLDDCVANYPKLIKVLPPEAAPLAGTVKSANDRLTPALQAADMLVGQALLSLRTGTNSKVVDVLTAKNIERFNCLETYPASIPKTIERLNVTWTKALAEKAEKKAQRDKIYKAKK